MKKKKRKKVNTGDDGCVNELYCGNPSTMYINSSFYKYHDFVNYTTTKMKE